MSEQISLWPSPLFFTKKFCVFYANIRGIKSKINSLKEVIGEKKPVIICIVETHLAEGELIEIDGYDTIYRNDKTNDSGGILIASINGLQNILMEV